MEEKENNVQNFLLGIRDNLLKPMTADINSNTDVCGEKILQLLAELKSNVEENTQRNEALVSKLHDDVKQLREEMNQKFHATLSDACAASQTITWN